MICIWAVLLPQQGEGRTIEAFDDKFFDWWSWQILAIEDYLLLVVEPDYLPDVEVLCFQL